MEFALIANLIVGFFAGIIFRSFYNPGVPFVFVSMAVGITFAAFGTFLVSTTDRRKFYITASFIIISFGVGLLYFDFKSSETAISDFDEIISQKVTARGYVGSEPQNKNGFTSFILKAESFERGQTKYTNNDATKVQVTARFIPNLKYGDRLNISGTIKRPENRPADNTENGTPAFDYVSYLARDNIYLQMSFPKVERLPESNEFSFQIWLFSIRNAFLSNVNSVMPEPAAALLNGITLGTRAESLTAISPDFNRASISHIIVLSGYNISVVANVLMDAFDFLPIALRSIFGAFGIIIFTIMTGGETAAVRAAIMALLIMLARATGRIYEAAFALIVAAFAMVLLNPKLLVFDMSFQLSFLATAGIIFIVPILEDKIHVFQNWPKWIREALISTLAASLAVFPLIVFKMKMLSLVGIPVNIIIAPLVPWLMVLGYAIGAIGFVAMPIALLLSFVAYPILSFIIWLAHTSASLPFAYLTINFFPASAMLVYYTILIWLIFKQKKYSL